MYERTAGLTEIDIIVAFVMSFGAKLAHTTLRGREQLQISIPSALPKVGCKAGAPDSRIREFRAPTVYIYKLFTGVYRVYYLGLFTAHCVNSL